MCITADRLILVGDPPRYLATGGTDGSINIWNDMEMIVSSSIPVAEYVTIYSTSHFLTGLPSSSIHQLSYSFDGEYIASAARGLNQVAFVRSSSLNPCQRLTTSGLVFIGYRTSSPSHWHAWPSSSPGMASIEIHSGLLR